MNSEVVSIRNSMNLSWRGSEHSEWHKNEQGNNAGKVLMPREWLLKLLDHSTVAVGALVYVEL